MKKSMIILTIIHIFSLCQAIEPFNLVVDWIQSSCAHISDITTKLIKAIKDDNIPALKELLQQQNVNLELHDHIGFTPLHWAALKCNTEALKLLLAAGANVNTRAKPSHENNILFKLNDIYRFLKLIDRATGETHAASRPLSCGLTPLHIACAMSNDTHPRTVIPRDGATLIATLIAHKANVNAATLHNFTPLIFAAYSNNAAIIAALLAAGANPDIADSIDNTTPLSWAAACTWNPAHRQSLQQAELEGTHNVQQFLSAGANPYIPNSNGALPLDKAIYGGNSAIVEAFLQNGVNPNSGQVTDQKPLLVVLCKDPTTLKLVIEAGKNIKKDEQAFLAEELYYNQPLISCLLHGKQEDFSQHLMYYENLPTSQDKTDDLCNALMFCYGQSYHEEAHELYTLLDAEHFPVRALLCKALHYAVTREDAPITEMLITLLGQRKESLNHRELDNLLKIAVQNSAPDVVEVLLRAGAPTTAAEAFITYPQRTKIDKNKEEYYATLLKRWTIHRQGAITNPNRTTYLANLTPDVRYHLLEKYIATAPLPTQ